ncbi:MAG TPA: winged helix DNA-binding domain-containing protein [Chloroflexota bacterium]|nr:winged helix DNA-binding domain-containing protein [Chloroflexota bacterium]
MILNDIPRRRLASQRLIEPLPSALDVVRWLGPIQAQDYGAAKWAVGQRTREASEADIDRLFDEGLILRTHVMRPTWHLVLPKDARWLLALTGPKVRRQAAARWRELGIDEAAVSRANTAFSRALSGGRHLTRAELGQVLSEAGLSPDGQRLPHFLLAAELDCVIISGPRRGKQLTYASFEERVGHSERPAAEAAGELAGRYFRSHGPAQLRDFVWWSGLTMAAARKAVSLAGLGHELIEGRGYWFDPEVAVPLEHATVGYLLANFDEYTIGYTDRSALVDAGLLFGPAHFAYGNILSNVVTLDGRVRGGWRRKAVGDRFQVELRLLNTLGPLEMVAIEQACTRLGRFLGREVDLVVR